MVMQALTRLYETLVASGMIAAVGWTEKPVGYVICLGANGQLNDVVCIQHEVESGKKKKMVSPMMRLPASGKKRSNNICAEFLCDNGSYMFGLRTNEKNKNDPAVCMMTHFENLKSLYHAILDDVNVTAAYAVLTFLDNWVPEDYLLVPKVAELPPTCFKDNFIFQVDGTYVHEIPEIQAAWDAYYQSMGAENEVIGQCLITGKMAPIAMLHPVVKQVQGAHASGASLSTHNMSSVSFYGKAKNFNAPVSKYAAFAYTEALNYLTRSRKNHMRMGDLSVLCWSESGNDSYAEFSSSALFVKTKDEGDKHKTDVLDVLHRLVRGLPCDDVNLSPDEHFHVLGLSANGPRLILRFYYEDTFGHIMKNVDAHYERAAIQKDATDTRVLDVFQMCRALTKSNAKKWDEIKSELSVTLVNDIFSSFVFGVRYPRQVLSNVMNRVCVSDTVTWQQAAVIKAYFLRNLPENDKRKELFTVGLNVSNDNPAYVCGRLFAIYEKLQKTATNATRIHDAYFSSAMRTPGLVFPTLASLSQKHLQKLDDKLKIWYDKQITELKSMLVVDGAIAYPKRLQLPEQGLFDLGYYHQKERLYTKKEETKDGKCDSEPV